MLDAPLILSVISFLLNIGPSLSSCTTHVSVKDLGCSLHWSCSDVNTTMTTFTVQAKAQGAEWQDVPHCVQVSSSSCDLSQVFRDLDLYNFVKLGLNQEHGEINWTSAVLCDPVKDANASFSPPLLSLYLNEKELWVEVRIPCAPDALCETIDEDEEGNEEGTPPCCPISDNLPFVNTTVTLYNKHNKTSKQTRTEDVMDSLWKLQFVGLVPGQEYCAVARFVSSPLSNPVCVTIPPLNNPNLYALAVYGVCIAFLVIVGFVLRKRLCQRALTDLRLPKSLMSLQIQDQEGYVVDEPRQTFFEEEESIVHVSIVSLNHTLPLETQETSSYYPYLQSLGDRYYTTSFLHDQFSDKNQETDYHSTEKDGVTDACVISAQYLWPRWSSLPALRTGMVCLLGNFLSSETSGVPLSSVRVAGDVQIAKTGSDHSFKALPTLYKGGD
ncbi:uncharacterized protein Hap1MRO34_009981 isoform 2-T3 [Clarias gariepinus]|nr:uncharacterized protein si:dkeyp-75h12.7 isoform X2 [Clarias gariepinus]XP_053356460.1 uncharacterized protein si:dkeyp-75h12.7 isoform X2 [Clarias gariepinus]